MEVGEGLRAGAENSRFHANQALVALTEQPEVAGWRERASCAQNNRRVSCRAGQQRALQSVAKSGRPLWVKGGPP